MKFRLKLGHGSVIGSIRTYSVRYRNVPSSIKLYDLYRTEIYPCGKEISVRYRNVPPNMENNQFQ